jgi:hypothetical protein
MLPFGSRANRRIDSTRRKLLLSTDLGLSNVTGTLSGTLSALDLGAYELGAPLPHYGPRPVPLR